MAVDDIVAGHGVVYVAPYGTALPANHNASLNAGFKSLGEVSEEGLAHAFNVSADMLRNWKGDAVKTLKTTTDITFGLTFLEDTDRVLELFYGADLNSGGGISDIELGRPEDKAYAMVIAYADGTNEQRYVLPRVEVMERGDKTVNPSSVGWSMTFAALYDDVEDNNGTLQFNRDITETG
jgi:hypothetical protein